MDDGAPVGGDDGVQKFGGIAAAQPVERAGRGVAGLMVAAIAGFGIRRDLGMMPVMVVRAVQGVFDRMGDADHGQ